MRTVWIWTLHGWVPIVVDESKPEARELTGAEKMRSLYFFARLFGMDKAVAQHASFFELYEFVNAHMGVEHDDES